MSLITKSITEKDFYKLKSSLEAVKFKKLPSWRVSVNFPYGALSSLTSFFFFIDTDHSNYEQGDYLNSAEMIEDLSYCFSVIRETKPFLKEFRLSKFSILNQKRRNYEKGMLIFKVEIESILERAIAALSGDNSW